MTLLRPEDAGRVYADAFNRGDLDALMGLYESGATLIAQPEQVASGLPAIREALTQFLALRGRMELAEPLQTVQADDVALVSAAWTLNGTGPDGAPVTLSGRSTDVIRRQADGTWRWLLDVPFGIG